MPKSDSNNQSAISNGKRAFAVRCRRFLKGELAAAEVTYADLVRRLAGMGIVETEGSIAMKISRGLYPAWFLLAVMEAIDRRNKRIGDI